MTMSMALITKVCGCFRCVEHSSLVTALKSTSLPRPGVYDMMKSTLDSLDFIVSRVRVTNLRNNAFIARVHYCQKASSVKEFDVDSRPSDAINLACRFNVPIFVNKTVALATAVQVREKRSWANLKYYFLSKSSNLKPLL